MTTLTKNQKIWVCREVRLQIIESYIQNLIPNQHVTVEHYIKSESNCVPYSVLDVFS